MANTLTLSFGYTGGGGGRTKAVEKSASALVAIDEIVAIGATNFQVTAAVDVSELEAVFINSDQDLLLETNSGSSPQEAINLKANVPLVWHANGYFPVPFAGDVTSMYFTNASGIAANVLIRILQDATP